MFVDQRREESEERRIIVCWSKKERIKELRNQKDWGQSSLHTHRERKASCEDRQGTPASRSPLWSPRPGPPPCSPCPASEPKSFSRCRCCLGGSEPPNVAHLSNDSLHQLPASHCPLPITQDTNRLLSFRIVSGSRSLSDSREAVSSSCRFRNCSCCSTNSSLCSYNHILHESQTLSGLLSRACAMLSSSFVFSPRRVSTDERRVSNLRFF